jgi:hypothetical protein
MTDERRLHATLSHSIERTAFLISQIIDAPDALNSERAHRRKEASKRRKRLGPFRNGTEVISTRSIQSLSITSAL